MAIVHSLIASALFVTGVVTVDAAAANSPVYPNCAKVTFNAPATASNLAFTLNVSDSSTWNQTVQQRLFTTGAPFTLTSKIVARYCEPENYVAGRSHQLEFLLHSITNNKNLWSGLGEPGKGFEGDSYSWIAYASKQGYATLSLDRLGNGESDHPDPILVVQSPYESALYHQMIQQIKTGKNSPLPKTYDDIILIGNSYGSSVIDNMLLAYPEDVSKAILTGYTYEVLASFPGILSVGPVPAALAIPARFALLPLGYFTTTSVPGRRGAFYGVEPYVDFPFDITTLDNEVRDVVSVGQLLTNYLIGGLQAPKYTGRVLILTGEEDNAFCGTGTTLIEPPVHCGQRLPDTRNLFPNSDFNWYSVDKTGHSNPFHTSRNVSFEVAHAFIGGAKFSKTGGA